MRTCSKCKALKPLSEFGPRKHRPAGVQSWCRTCCAIASKAYGDAHPAWKKHVARERRVRLRSAGTLQEVERGYQLSSKYGLSVEQYDALFTSQLGLCAICQAPLEPGRRTHVDHNHATRAVRGLLCSGHNLMLGHAKDNAAVLRAAADYLDKHSLRASDPSTEYFATAAYAGFLQ
jgi:hypothetical protein